ncbi:hypothetical protein QJS66_10710 [Kocuria rhizophila]|nr:hypothetical protein QJS66_10710 [Kocuria rhizophila]
MTTGAPSSSLLAHALTARRAGRSRTSTGCNMDRASSCGARTAARHRVAGHGRSHSLLADATNFAPACQAREDLDRLSRGGRWCMGLISDEQLRSRPPRCTRAATARNPRVLLTQHYAAQPQRR